MGGDWPIADCRLWGGDEAKAAVHRPVSTQFHPPTVSLHYQIFLVLHRNHAALAALSVLESGCTRTSKILTTKRRGLHTMTSCCFPSTQALVAHLLISRPWVLPSNDLGALRHRLSISQAVSCLTAVKFMSCSRKAGPSLLTKHCSFSQNSTNARAPPFLEL